MARTTIDKSLTGNKVLQYQSFVKNTSFATSSTSPQATGLAVTITPSSTSSKILIIVHSGLRSDTASVRADASLYRNGSNVDGSQIMNTLFSAAATHIAPASMHWIDSPASTSPQTYEARLNSGTGGTTVEFSGNNGGLDQSIIAIELA